MNTKEFFKRWGEGIQKVTPLQTTKVQLIGNIIILIGVITGILTAILYHQWWLMIVLLGSFIVMGLQFTGNIQKYLALKKIDNIMKSQIIIQEEMKGGVENGSQI